jgi:hypothetical protein
MVLQAESDKQVDFHVGHIDDILNFRFDSVITYRKIKLLFQFLINRFHDKIIQCLS